MMLEREFLEPERLRAFVAVAETGSFTRAAKRLYLTQPAVSGQVRRLEDTIGKALFEREAQSVRLTPAGEDMLGYARELLEVLARARRQFSQSRLEGSIRLGLIDDFNRTALLELLGQLCLKHTRFELITAIGTSAELMRRLEAGELDLIVVRRMPGETHGEFLCRQQMVWAGKPNVLGSDGEPVPLALYPPGSPPRDVILQSLRTAGRRWSVRFESESISSLRAAVLAGLGVAVFGLGMIPEDVPPLPPGLLPSLPELEFILVLNPTNQDTVVGAFAGVMRTVAPLIIERMAEDQAAWLIEDR